MGRLKEMMSDSKDKRTSSLKVFEKMFKAENGNAGMKCSIVSRMGISFLIAKIT